MADLKGIHLDGRNIEVRLSLNQGEYKLLENSTDDVVVLPSGRKSLKSSLTTGKLGNSNRIMLPKKLLALSGIKKLEKKVPASLFPMNGDAFLLIKIKKSKLGIPKFGDDGDED